MKNSIKIIVIMFFTFTIMSLLTVVNAASASISANKTTVTPGTNVTISINGTAATWNLKVSGALSKNYAGYDPEGENRNISETLTFNSSKEGTYVISLSGDITDAVSGTKSVNDSVTIVVKKQESTSNTSNTSNGDNVTFSSKGGTVYATSKVNVRSTYNTSGSVLGQLQANDAVTRTGVGSNGWTKVSYNGKTGYVKSSYLTTTKPAGAEDPKPEEKKPEEEKTEEISTNSLLQSLTLTPSTLEEDFNPTTTTYKMTVDATVEKIEVVAVAENEKSVVQVSGNDKLEIGQNVITISVTAEDGVTKTTYTIYVEKSEEVKLGLTSLKIDGYELDPEFNSLVYEYTLNIKDKKVKELVLEALANDEKATVEIVGNENMKAGENTITITVTNEAGETVMYQITVNNGKGIPFKLQYVIIGSCGLGVVVLVILLIVIIKKGSNKNNNGTELNFYNYKDNADNGDEEEENEIPNNYYQPLEQSRIDSQEEEQEENDETENVEETEPEDYKEEVAEENDVGKKIDDFFNSTEMSEYVGDERRKKDRRTGDRRTEKGKHF